MMNWRVTNVVLAHRCFCPPDWEWVYAGGVKRYHAFWLVLRGCGRMEVGGKVYPLSVGDCFLLQKWLPCHGQHHPAHPLTVYAITFDAGGNLDLPLHQKVPELEFFRNLCDRAIDAYAAGEPAAAAGWVEALLEEWQTSACREANTETVQKVMVDQICARIRQAPGTNYSISALARECHYSQQHFVRLFKKFTRQEPRRFIIQARIEAAAGLLRMSDYPIAKIAALLGYYDPFHFSRQFKEHTGLSPTAFRENI